MYEEYDQHQSLEITAYSSQVQMLVESPRRAGKINNKMFSIALLSWPSAGAEELDRGTPIHNFET